ncbi:MAG TPA: 30S ribosome-binding factor RbfA [Acidimicrobiia bacterium]|nr:30S ribosome-binding factor RbfA [Acidimicrobiia bacterium]
MSKPSFPRTRRINAIIREVLAEEVEELADPRLGMVTITGVEVAPDMRRAVVYVSALDQDHLDETIKGLTAAAPRLRAAMGRQIHTKYTPTLEFRQDQGVVQGERIDALLRELEQHDS